MKTIAKVVEAYNALEQDKRMALQKEFGDTPFKADRERNFYRWLRKNKKV